jgi:nicotinate-nucleotide adenylyltransferase
MKVGLFFGSFNPIHIGHLMVAQAVINNNLAESVWFVVSPQNPFKESNDLLDENERLFMVQEATKTNTKFMVSDVEFALSKPSYTYQTIEELKKTYPNHDFSIIIGSDNLVIFDKWKHFNDILSNCELIVYPRLGSELKNEKIPIHKYKVLDVPIIDISSTQIRKMCQNKQSVQYMVDDNTFKILQENRYYSY